AGPGGSDRADLATRDRQRPPPLPRSRLGEALSPRHLAFQLGEAHGAEIERTAVKPLEVEALAGPFAGLLPDRQPGTLAELVADGLAGPPQVSIHFASQEVFGLMAMLDRERQHQVGLPGLAAVIRLLGRDRQLQMDANIHDDPHGANGLGP